MTGVCVRLMSTWSALHTLLIIMELVYRKGFDGEDDRVLWAVEGDCH